MWSNNHNDNVIFGNNAVAAQKLYKQKVLLGGKSNTHSR